MILRGQVSTLQGSHYPRLLCPKMNGFQIHSIRWMRIMRYNSSFARWFWLVNLSLLWRFPFSISYILCPFGMRIGWGPAFLREGTGAGIIGWYVSIATHVVLPMDSASHPPLHVTRIIALNRRSLLLNEEKTSSHSDPLLHLSVARGWYCFSRPAYTTRVYWRIHICYGSQLR